MNNYPYMSLPEKTFIEHSYLRRRKSKDSRRNVFILLGSFSNFMKKELFSATFNDAAKYLDYLQKNKIDGKYKEEYCNALLIELRSFYQFATDCKEIEYNPFADLTGKFKGKDLIRVQELPTILQIDQLLTAVKKDPMLYTAVLLSFRMALPIRDIAELKKEQFCYEEGKADIYLRINRLTTNGKQDHFLLVPDDIVPKIQETIQMTSASFPYLLQNAKGRPYSIRRLQAKLKDAQVDLDFAVTFSNIRSLAIYLLLAAQAPLDAIAGYVGVEGRWLTKYDRIPSEQKYEAMRYVNIRIVPDTE